MHSQAVHLSVKRCVCGEGTLDVSDGLFKTGDLLYYDAILKVSAIKETKN